MQRRHTQDIQNLKDNIKQEQEQWIESMIKKHQEDKEEYKRKLKEDMIKERNREIEAVINKLGDDTHSTQKQLVQQYEKKVKEVESKHR